MRKKGSTESWIVWYELTSGIKGCKIVRLGEEGFMKGFNLNSLFYSLLTHSSKHPHLRYIDSMVLLLH